MSLRLASEISTRVTRDTDSETPRSELLVSGVLTGRHVSGAVLEAAVQWNGFYLLFMTDDTPFEEMLSIQLLDSTWNLKDTAVLGGPYSSGSFSALELIEPNSLRFRFIGCTDWYVEILPRPKFQLPFISDVAGVRRPLGFFRHFIVSGNPRPQTR